MLTLYTDTETTDMIKWSDRSAHESQPHIVQIAALLYCDELERVVQSIDLTVRALDWEITHETVLIHGISKELSQKIGILESDAIFSYHVLAEKADKIKFHNKGFDVRVIKTAFVRYFKDEIVGFWVDCNHQCTLVSTREYLKPINKERKEQGFERISSSLGSIYEHLFDKPLVNAHSAMADARACMEIDLELKKRALSDF